MIYTRGMIKHGVIIHIPCLCNSGVMMCLPIILDSSLILNISYLKNTIFNAKSSMRTFLH